VSSPSALQVILNPILSDPDPFKISSEITIHLSLLDVIFLTLYRGRAAVKSASCGFILVLLSKREKLTRSLLLAWNNPLSFRGRVQSLCSEWLVRIKLQNGGKWY